MFQKLKKEKTWEDEAMPMGQNLPITFPSTSYQEVTEANRKCALQAKQKQRLGLALWLTYQVAQGTHQLLFQKMWENTDSPKNSDNAEHPWRALNKLSKKEAFYKVRLKLYKVILQSFVGDIVQDPREP